MQNGDVRDLLAGVELSPSGEQPLGDLDVRLGRLVGVLVGHLLHALRDNVVRNADRAVVDLLSNFCESDVYLLGDLFFGGWG